MRKFDLNIEKVLEDWDVSDAVREIIANAIDEELLTETSPITISKNRSAWHIRDFGRGLQYKHLTQKENQEKLSRRDVVIGKFGVGLKDALATLERNNVKVSISSKHGDISLGRSSKQGFDDVVTLHALIDQPSDPEFVGTEFILDGVDNKQIERAKDFFLRFSGEKLLEQTKYGQVLKRYKSHARIYINGVRVAEEPEFLFSYNITSLTKPMEKALNRERTHVGRAAYTQRVKDILLECRESLVAEVIAKDLKNFEKGKLHDELKWLDVAVHGCKLLNATGKYIFITPTELRLASGLIEHAEADGNTVVTIPENVREKLRGLTDLAGSPIRDLDQYVKAWNQSFQFTFVGPEDLTKAELGIFNRTDEIFEVAGGRPARVKDVLISETMRLEGLEEAVGVWEPRENRIVIKRSQLASLHSYAGTLLHEMAHVTSGAPDVSRRFEDELTTSMGTVTANSLR
jgi:hypothetical protein